MNWEIVLIVAFGTIGILEYIKGFFQEAPTKYWRLLQPVLCLLISAIYAILPVWVTVGLLGLAFSQLGYEVVVSTVKKKMTGG